MKMNDRVLVHFSNGYVEEGVIVGLHTGEYCYEVDVKITSDNRPHEHRTVYCRENDLELI